MRAIDQTGVEVAQAMTRTRGYKRGLYGQKYVWFLISCYEDDRWTDVEDLDRTLNQIEALVEGHLTIEGSVLNWDDRQTVSGYTSKDWLRRY